MTSDDITTASTRNQAGAATQAIARTVRCPFCKAAIGIPCQRLNRRGGPARFPHPSRTDAAIALTPTEGS